MEKAGQFAKVLSIDNNRDKKQTLFRKQLSFSEIQTKLPNLANYAKMTKFKIF